MGGRPELRLSAASTHDPSDVALYNRVADALWSAAVTGDEARRIIQNAAQGLRELD